MSSDQREQVTMMLMALAREVPGLLATLVAAVERIHPDETLSPRARSLLRDLAENGGASVVSLAATRRLSPRALRRGLEGPLAEGLVTLTRAGRGWRVEATSAGVQRHETLRRREVEAISDFAREFSVGEAEKALDAVRFFSKAFSDHLSEFGGASPTPKVTRATPTA